MNGLSLPAKYLEWGWAPAPPKVVRHAPQPLRELLHLEKLFLRGMMKGWQVS